MFMQIEYYFHDLIPSAYCYRPVDHVTLQFFKSPGHSFSQSFKWIFPVEKSNWFPEAFLPWYIDLRTAYYFLTYFYNDSQIFSNGGDPHKSFLSIKYCIHQVPSFPIFASGRFS